MTKQLAMKANRLLLTDAYQSKTTIKIHTVFWHQDQMSTLGVTEVKNIRMILFAKQ